MGVCANIEKDKRKNIKANNSFYLEGTIQGKEPKEVILKNKENNEDVKGSDPGNINNDNITNQTNNEIVKQSQKSSNANEDEFKKVTPDEDQKSKIKDSKINIKINYDLFDSKKSNNEIINNDKDKDNEIKKSLEGEKNLSSSNKILESKFLTNGNNNSIKENLEDNYKNFDINKEHYLICGDCNYYITHIYSVEFNDELNNFKFTYKCQCKQNENENKEKYLHEIINDKKMCDEHFSTEIKYICETCNKQICEKCKDSNAHLEHDIKQIITNEVIPESIMDSIKDKENNFKGFKIFEKIYDFYKRTRLPDERSRISEISRTNSEENPFKKSNEKNNENNGEIKKEQNEQENNEEKNSENKESKIKDENANEQEIQKKSENDINVKENLNVTKSKIETENKNINEMDLNNPGNMNNTNDNQRNEDDENENKNQNLNDNNPLNINEKKDNIDNIDNIGEKPEIINISQTNNNIPKENQEMNKLNGPNTNIINENNDINNDENNKNENSKIENDNRENAENENENKENLIDDNKYKENLEIENNNKENLDIKNNNIESGENNNNPKENERDSLPKQEENFEIINNLNNSTNSQQNQSKNNMTNNQLSLNKIDEKDTKIIEQSSNNPINNIISSNNENKFNENLIPNSMRQINQRTLKNYKNTKTLIGHENRIVSMIILSSGYIATGAYDNSIRIWDPKKNGQEALIESRFSIGYILCLLELKPNLIYAGNSVNAIDIFDLNIKSIDPNLRLKNILLVLLMMQKYLYGIPKKILK